MLKRKLKYSPIKNFNCNFTIQEYMQQKNYPTKVEHIIALKRACIFYLLNSFLSSPSKSIMVTLSEQKARQRFLKVFRIVSIFSWCCFFYFLNVYVHFKNIKFVVNLDVFLNNLIEISFEKGNVFNQVFSMDCS